MPKAADDIPQFFRLNIEVGDPAVTSIAGP
jgi:hypothetical protein